MEITLRDYQSRLIDSVRAELRAGHKSVLMVAPTGSGKTVMFSYIAGRAAARGTTVGVFAHREELLEQISRTLTDFHVPHGLIAAGSTRPVRHPVQVIAAQTYARRVQAGRDVPQFGLMIVDEAHHAVPGSTWARCLGASPGGVVIGVTATPERLDGRGLGDLFGRMVIGPSTADLIQAGALTPYKLRAPPSQVDLSAVHKRGGDFARDEIADLMDRPSITGDAVQHYLRHVNGRRAVAFATSVAHAEHIAEQFRAQGIEAATIDGGMDRQTRRQVVADFRAGAVRVLASCDVISEGFDLPGIEAAILLRPTASLALYLQQVGRALRPASGKTHAVLLDHVDNWRRHGLPDDDRDWSLEGRSASRRKSTDQQIENRQCPECYAVNPGRAARCCECGHEFRVMGREVEQVDGELVEVDTETARRQRSPEVVARLREQGRAASLDALIELGKQRGMKNAEGWARHVLAAREAKRAGVR